MISTPQHPDEARAIKQRLENLQNTLRNRGLNLGKDACAPSLAANGLFPIEYRLTVITSPPRLRDTRSPGAPFLDTLQTLRLSDGHGNFLAVFSSPLPVIQPALTAAEAELDKARDARQKLDGSKLETDIEALGKRVDELYAARQLAELSRAALELDESEKHREQVRNRRDAAIREAETKLANAKADLERFDRTAPRYLRIERDAWTHGNATSGQLLGAHESTEVVRAVDKQLTIDLTKWHTIDRDAPIAPLPLDWIELLIPVPLPDIKDWCTENYEEIDPDAPASAGIGASELHRAYLQAHGLQASQCPLESFSAIVGEIFARKRGNNKRAFMVQMKLTEAQKEAHLRAQFEAERAAREAAEFAEWKRQRVEAATQ